MKDDSGSYAIFTEQGSSTSQLTAAKMMGFYIKTTRIRKTSSRRNINLHPGQNGRCTITVQNSEVRMSRYLDTSFRNANDQNHGPTWKTQSFFLSEIFSPAPTQHDNFDLNNVDCVPSKAKCARSVAMLYIFEDDEALIKMIIKSRSPTMRHASRNHRVALDWLFDRIYLDPKIQIKYDDTKHQLADMMTKENFTCDEWNNLLHLFNISHFTSLCCAQNFSLTSCTRTMAKQMQEQKRDNKIVAKSKPTTMNLAVCLDKFFSCEQSDCVEKPGDTQGTLPKRLVKYRET